MKGTWGLLSYRKKEADFSKKLIFSYGIGYVNHFLEK